LIGIRNIFDLGFFAQQAGFSPLRQLFFTRKQIVFCRRQTAKKAQISSGILNQRRSGT